ncbi:MAG TPA: hypothetical protein PKA88_01650 [Polyangiaceae bacterium]|nr:hypothetical protein [Polyangiaceae bacterium]HMR79314.1 hypothetical protein [Polyangiaceae bacterium]
MPDATEGILLAGLADVARRDLLAAIAVQPHIRRLYLNSLVAELAALTAAETSEGAPGAAVLQFPGGPVEVDAE